MGFSAIAYAFSQQRSTRDGMRDSSTVSAANRRATSSLSGSRAHCRILQSRRRASLNSRPCPSCKPIRVLGHPWQRGRAARPASCPMIRCGDPSRVRCSTGIRNVLRYLHPNEQRTALGAQREISPSPRILALENRGGKAQNPAGDIEKGPGDGDGFFAQEDRRR